MRSTMLRRHAATARRRRPVRRADAGPAARRCRIPPPAAAALTRAAALAGLCCLRWPLLRAPAGLVRADCSWLGRTLAPAQTPDAIEESSLGGFHCSFEPAAPPAPLRRSPAPPPPDGDDPAPSSPAFPSAAAPRQRRKGGSKNTRKATSHARSFQKKQMVRENPSEEPHREAGKKQGARGGMCQISGCAAHRGRGTAVARPGSAAPPAPPRTPRSTPPRAEGGRESWCEKRGEMGTKLRIPSSEKRRLGFNDKTAQHSTTRAPASAQPRAQPAQPSRR